MEEIDMNRKKEKQSEGEKETQKSWYEKLKKWWLSKIWDIRESLKLNEHRKLKAIVTYVLALGFITIICMILNYTEIWADNVVDKYFGGNDMGFTYQDILFTQISVSFIVISLTTVLSSSSKIVYWIDLIQMELVEPILTDFLAYSMYIFACLTASIYFVVEKSHYVVISFGISIVLMVLLTLKMITVNFESEYTRQKIKMYFDWIATKEKEGESKLYKEMISSFVNTNVKYAQEKNVVAFFENFDFLYDKFENKEDDLKADCEELEMIGLTIELLGRENDYFLWRIVSQIDLKANGEGKYSKLRKYIKSVMKKLKDASPKDDKSSLYNLIDVLSK